MHRNTRQGAQEHPEQVLSQYWLACSVCSKPAALTAIAASATTVATTTVAATATATTTAAVATTTTTRLGRLSLVHTDGATLEGRQHSRGSTYEYS
jgi:hypothetical protein